MSQNMEALALANKVRLEHANLKRKIAALPAQDGRRLVAEVIANHVGPTGQIKVRHLLGAIERVGEVQVMLLLQHAGIYNPDKRIAALTSRQQKALIDAVQDKTTIYPFARTA